MKVGLLLGFVESRMNRNEFLKMSALIPVVATSNYVRGEQIDSNESKNKIPNWVNEEIEKARLRVEAWRKHRNCATFAFITDLHSGILNTGYDKTDYILYLNKVAEELKVDAVLNLGDWGFEFPIKKEHDGMALLKKILENHAQTKIPTFFCIGNHDHYYKRFSNEFLGWQFPKQKNAVYSPSCDYGYADFPEKECRIFFLNSSDSYYYGISNKQIDFLKSNLGSMPKNWTALVFDHYCFDILGQWVGYPMKPQHNELNYRKILKEFVDAGGKLAGNITGDSHFDRTFNREGVNFFISQGYGGIAPKHRPSDVDILPIDYKKQMLVEVVMVDSKNREIKFVRVGVGGESRDRLAKF